MITNSFVKFGPGVVCFSYGTNGAWTEYGPRGQRTRRPMTEQELDWMWYPPTHDIDELQALNDDEAGAEVCEHCYRFHPVLVKYNDWDKLCPECVEDGEEYYKSMYEDVYGNLL